MKNIGEDLYMV